MILTDEGLYVLDLSEVGSGHPLEEAAFFWAYLEALKLNPWYSKRRVRVCQAAFLAAACGHAELPPFWQRWGMFMRLSYLTRSEERVGRISGIRLWRRKFFRKRMRHWLANQSWA